MYQQHIIVGNLGSDPVLRYTPNGTPVCNFTVAVNKTWTSQAGERMEKVTWFRITCWRALADNAAQYLSKGRQVLIEGEVGDASAWTDKNGEMRATNEVTANVIKFLGKAGDQMVVADAGEAEAEPELPEPQSESQPVQPAPAKRTAQPAARPQAVPAGEVLTDEEIPW